MDFGGNTRLTLPNLSYTSREFISIYEDLIKAIPNFTKEWEPKDESDPGVVLLKMMSMLGDMLSYNLDKQALEAFPRTVLQRANAQQIFRLVGYKMHWWRSAQVDIRITNTNSFPITIGRYNVFTTKNNEITYTNLNQLEVPGGSTGIGSYRAQLVQGTPVTPLMNTDITPDFYNQDWHEVYDYNIHVNELKNNRLYLKFNNIDETSITLIDNDELPFAVNEWKQVENINTSETLDKVFEFDVDEDNMPFIQFPNYWNEKYIITRFKLFCVLSNGKDGEIEENSLTRVDGRRCYVNQNNVNINQALDQVALFNTPSTYGFNPETCTEARQEAEKYINTIDTLVVLRDFEKAVLRLESIANVRATDIQIDPYAEEMTNNQINLWVVRKNDYNNLGSSYIYEARLNETVDQLFKENLVGELASKKLMPYSIHVNLENRIEWIDWSVRGEIFLRKPINIDQNHDLMVRINNNLKNRFNTETLDFNEPINYMDVIETIMKTDKIIWHVDLSSSAIEYSKVKRSNKGNPTGLTIINKYRIYDDGVYSNYYTNSISCATIETIIDENGKQIRQVTHLGDGTVVPGGSGFSKNAGNRIIREDGNPVVIGLDLGDPHNPREYEIYNRRIWDWTGLEPCDTNRFIDTSTYPYKIMIDNNDGTFTETPYTLEFDSRMYLPDGSDANRKLKDNYRQIDSLNNLTLSDILTDDEIQALIPQEKQDLLNENKLREVWDIIDTQYDDWTGQTIDKLTGQIFVRRGTKWYSSNRTYDETTGEILDSFGDVLYNEDGYIMREPVALTEVTGEHIQTFDVEDGQVEFNFFLGQDAIGNALLDDVGNIINAYPIKPYSLFIWINGDREMLSDTGSGRIQGTPGILNGSGSIDYETGQVSFTLNMVPEQPLKILYAINKLAYTNYLTFNPAELFVRPEYIRNENRK